MIRGMEQLSCEDRLREFRLFSLERRGLQLDLIEAFQYLIGTTRKMRTNIFAGPVVVGQGAMVLN